MGRIGFFEIMVLAGLFWLPALVLLARISHWAYSTQEKLDESNRLLRKLAGQSAHDASAERANAEYDHGPGI